MQVGITHRVGLQLWDPPPLLRHLRREDGVAFSPGKPVLLADTAAVSSAFHSLAELHLEDRLFRTPKGGGTIEVQMRWFHPEILTEGP